MGRSMRKLMRGRMAEPGFSSEPEPGCWLGRIAAAHHAPRREGYSMTGSIFFFLLNHNCNMRRETLVRVAGALSIRANAALLLAKRIPEKVTGFCSHYRVRALTAVTVSWQ